MWCGRCRSAWASRAYVYGSLTGVWNVDWITFWGVVLFNTLVLTGTFENFRALAHRPGHRRRARADHAVRLGVRRAARGPGRLRLSVGGGRADPDRARHPRSRRHPRRGDRQQRAGVLRRARRADHRAGGGDRACRCWRSRPRSATSSRSWRCCRRGCCSTWCAGAEGIRERLAARDRRLARLHRRAVSGRGLSRPVPARHHRLDRLLRLPAGPAASCGGRSSVLGYGGVPVVGGGRGGGGGGRPGAAGGRDIPRLAAVHRADRGGGAVDRAVVDPAQDQPVQASRSRRTRSLTPGAVVRAVFNFAPFIGGTAILRLLDHRRAAAAGRAGRSSARCSPARSTRCGARAGRRVHLRARLRVQLLGHGGLAGQRLLAASAPCSSSSRRSSAGSASRCRAATPRPTRCSASSRRWSGSCSACRRCCCRRSTRWARRSASRSRRRPRASGVSTSRFVRNEGEVIRHNMGWTL